MKNSDGLFPGLSTCGNVKGFINKADLEKATGFDVGVRRRLSRPYEDHDRAVLGPQVEHRTHSLILSQLQ